MVDSPVRSQWCSGSRAGENGALHVLSVREAWGGKEKRGIMAHKKRIRDSRLSMLLREQCKYTMHQEKMQQQREATQGKYIWDD
jgi:hypothetical protein